MNSGFFLEPIVSTAVYDTIRNYFVLLKLCRLHGQLSILTQTPNPIGRGANEITSVTVLELFTNPAFQLLLGNIWEMKCL